MRRKDEEVRNRVKINLCWKGLAERMEEEVLDKYKVQESKKGAFKGRGNTLEGKRVCRNKKYKIRKWREDCWARIFSVFREYNLQRLQSKQEEQQQRMAIMKDLIKKIRSKGSMDAPNLWCVAELLAKDCEKAWTPHRMGGHHAIML